MIAAFAAMALASGPMLFRGTTDWVLLSSNGTVERRLATIGGLRVTEAAVSPKGDRWAAVANERVPQLLLLSAPDARPRTVDGVGEFIHHPAFSVDGKWVYFVQNDLKHPTSGRTMSNYAELWRVRFDDGRVEKLTQTVGCHSWPQPVATGAIVFVHSTCEGEAGVEVVDRAFGEERLLVDRKERVEEVAVDSSGEKALIVAHGPLGPRLIERSLKNETKKLRAQVPRGGTALRPHWGDDGQTIWFQSGPTLMRLNPDDTVEQVLNLDEVAR